LGSVIIPEEYKKWFRYVTSEGEVYAVKPSREKLSPAEIARREAEHKAKRKLIVEERAKARAILKKARRAAKKNPTIDTVREMEDASRKIGKKGYLSQLFKWIYRFRSIRLSNTGWLLYRSCLRYN
jgi:hypothetical protein